jgi:prepilin-type N-terminal cleavage/methylation domain-containing protein
MIKSSAGFTLLEMMIAMTILAALTVLTSTSIRSAVQSQNKFEAQIEQDSQVREALRVMEKDIGLAFHHRDIYTAMINEINSAANKTGPGVTPTPGNAINQTAPPLFGGTNPQATPKPKTAPKELTAFIGDEKTLYFTSLSNVRVQRDEQASDQAKIGYFLKNCKSLDNRGKSSTSNCLWRRVSPTLDDQIELADPNAVESVIIENVVDFKLKYFGPDHDEWQNSWKTTDSDAAMKDHFPYAVEIYIKVQNKNNPKSKVVEMRMIAGIHFPNNEVKKDPASSPSPSPTPPPGPLAPAPGGR